MGVKLIVGLGNPGAQYAKNRHNAGYRVVDELADRLHATYWKDQCGAKVASVSHGGVDLLLAKPQTFMNESGGPVKKLAAQYKLKPEEVLVVHDELEIAAGDVKVKAGGGHGGHNGLRSIIDKMGTRNFVRLRIGIGRPPGRMDPATFVLTDPRGADADAFEDAITQGATLALNEVG